MVLLNLLKKCPVISHWPMLVVFVIALFAIPSEVETLHPSDQFVIGPQTFFRNKFSSMFGGASGIERRTHRRSDEGVQTRFIWLLSFWLCIYFGLFMSLSRMHVSRPTCFPELWFPKFGTDFHIKVRNNALNWLLSASIPHPKGVSRIPDWGDSVYCREPSQEWCIQATCIREIDVVPTCISHLMSIVKKLWEKALKLPVI